jgi:predicted phosphohydrolase
MNVWAIADPHLSLDPRVEKPMDVFGGSWVDHDRKLKDNWERLVEPEDLVIVAGDISWAMRLDEALADLAFLDALPGEKVILKGNHDLWWQSLSKIEKACEPLKTLHFLQHSAFGMGGVVVFGTRGWTCPGSREFTESDLTIYRREALRLEMSLAQARGIADKAGAETGKKPLLIGAMHYPPTNERQEPSEFTRIFGSSGAEMVVYGHLHGSNAFKNGPAGCLEGMEYRLVSLDKLACCPLLLARDI